jgi:hypothetical protein
MDFKPLLAEEFQHFCMVTAKLFLGTSPLDERLNDLKRRSNIYTLVKVLR